MNTTRRPNPATPQRAATQYHRTIISDLDEAYTYVHTIDYTLAYAALHCIAAKMSGRNLCTTGSRRQEPANRDPPQTWGDAHLFQLTSHPIPSSLLHVSIPCFSSSSLHCRTGTTGPCLHCISIHAPHLRRPCFFVSRTFASCRFLPRILHCMEGIMGDRLD
jgi:hypothetical protein